MSQTLVKQLLEDAVDHISRDKVASSMPAGEAYVSSPELIVEGTPVAEGAAVADSSSSPASVHAGGTPVAEGAAAADSSSSPAAAHEGDAHGNVENVALPIPKFILVGKRGVGKSSLLEAFAGEPFNFLTSALGPPGSRRPTVVELRNYPGLYASRWQVYHDDSKEWKYHPVEEVMEIVVKAHECLGRDVSEVPIWIKGEGADFTDLCIVDLPGFCSYASCDAARVVQGKIENMASKFMEDRSNIMLCVEEAGECAGYATLNRCMLVDPLCRRTILIRSKLEKLYDDLPDCNVDEWLEGFGNLPGHLPTFALSLPHRTSPPMPKAFHQLCSDISDRDVQQLKSKGMKGYWHIRDRDVSPVGLNNLKIFMGVQVEHMECKVKQVCPDALDLGALD